jgi:tetratricopeptide (TPR) repeat protein
MDQLMRTSEVLSYQGQMELAVTVVELAVRWFPKSPVPHYYLGRLESQKGNQARAEECFKRALELDPGHVPSDRALRALEG